MGAVKWVLLKNFVWNAGAGEDLPVSWTSYQFP